MRRVVAEALGRLSDDRMRQLAERGERVEPVNASLWACVRRLPPGLQILLQDALRRSPTSGDHRIILPGIIGRGRATRPRPGDWVREDR
jgi:hypothetical protein